MSANGRTAATSGGGTHVSPENQQQQPVVDARSDFFARLAAFHRQEKVPTPMIADRAIDLYELSRAVKACGGPERVCDRNLWAGMADQYGLNSECVNGSEAIKTIYYSYLWAFDRSTSILDASSVEGVAGTEDQPSALVTSHNAFADNNNNQNNVPNIVVYNHHHHHANNNNNSSHFTHASSSVNNGLGVSRSSFRNFDPSSPAMIIRKQQQMQLANRMMRSANPRSSPPAPPVTSASGKTVVSFWKDDDDLTETVWKSILALRSGYPNEISICMNKLLRAICEQSLMTSSNGAPMERCSSLVSILLAHVGFAADHLHGLAKKWWRFLNPMNIETFWKSHLNTNLVDKLPKTFPSVIIECIRSALDSCESSTNINDEPVILPTDGDVESTCTAEDVIMFKERVMVEQVFCLIRHLQRHPANCTVILEHPFAFEVICLVAASRTSSLVLGAKRDACDCLAELIHRFSLSGKISQSRIAFLLETTREMVMNSNDRLDVITGLDVLCAFSTVRPGREFANFLMVPHASLKSQYCRCLFDRISQLILLRDAGIVMCALECLYRITLELGTNLVLNQTKFVGNLVDTLVDFLVIDANSRFFPANDGTYVDLTQDEMVKLDWRIQWWIRSVIEPSNQYCASTLDLLTIINAAPFIPRGRCLNRFYALKALVKMFPSVYFRENMVFGLTIKSKACMVHHENPYHNKSSSSSLAISAKKRCGGAGDSSSAGKRRKCSDDQACKDVCQAVVSSLDLVDDVEAQAAVSLKLLINQITSNCAPIAANAGTLNLDAAAATPVLYECKWCDCHRKFVSIPLLFRHCYNAHAICASSRPLACLWQDCATPVERPLWSLVIHLKEHLLDGSSAKFQPIPANRIAPEGYSHAARIVRNNQQQQISKIPRQPAECPPMFEESALAKSSKLTSALILRNLAGLSCVTDLITSRHRRNILRIITTNKELCRPLARFLAAVDMNNDPKTIDAAATTTQTILTAAATTNPIQIGKQNAPKRRVRRDKHQIPQTNRQYKKTIT